MYALFSPEYFALLTSSSTFPLQYSTVQDNRDLAFILSRAQGAPDLHIQLFATAGTAPDRVIVHHRFTGLYEIDFRDRAAGGVWVVRRRAHY